MQTSTAAFAVPTRVFSSALIRTNSFSIVAANCAVMSGHLVAAMPFMPLLNYVLDNWMAQKQNQVPKLAA